MQVKQSQMQNIGLRKIDLKIEKLIIKESKLPKDFESSPDRVIWQAAQESFCGALSQNGFHVCSG